MKITESMKEVFSGLEIKQGEWYGDNSISYKVEIKVPNKWDAYLSLEDRGSQFTVYHGPCGHLSIHKFDPNSKSDLMAIRKLVEDYIKVMDLVGELRKSGKDIKSYVRDVKLEQLIS